MKYIDFLKQKIDIAPKTGLEISPDEVNPILKPHQRDAVMWAVRGGRRALFESFGLGKTVQALEWCNIITRKTGGRALIVLPLGVKQEFKRDAVELLGLPEPEYVRTMAEVKAASGCILLTNYERVRDGDIDPKYFTATSLDEAAVLRSFGSKTYQTFLDKFKGVPYKLVNTATPSPNKYKELIPFDFPPLPLQLVTPRQEHVVVFGLFQSRDAHRVFRVRKFSIRAAHSVRNRIFFYPFLRLAYLRDHRAILLQFLFSHFPLADSRW